MAQTMYCYRHPKRETRVSCATCGRPICTECMRQTDVGIKCPDDARLPRGARAGVMKPDQILKSFLAGAAVAIVGVPAVFLLLQLPFSWLLSVLAGYGAGTLIHRVGGRNGGPLAMSIAAVAVSIAFATRLVPLFLAGAFPVFILIPAILAAVAAVVGARGGL
ncbi:MAG: hypothetical protein WA990_07475 [Rubrobacteraceae bacterium]